MSNHRQRRFTTTLTVALIAALTATTVVSCAIDHSTTVPALDREATAVDVLPSHWDAELMHNGVDLDTQRFIGTDTEGFEYFAAARRGGGYCLIVYIGDGNSNPVNEYDTWRGACDEEFPVTIWLMDVTATLHRYGDTPVGADVEIIGNQISVERD